MAIEKEDLKILLRLLTKYDLPLVLSTIGRVLEAIAKGPDWDLSEEQRRVAAKWARRLKKLARS